MNNCWFIWCGSVLFWSNTFSELEAIINCQPKVFVFSFTLESYLFFSFDKTTISILDINVLWNNCIYLPKHWIRKNRFSKRRLNIFITSSWQSESLINIIKAWQSQLHSSTSIQTLVLHHHFSIASYIIYRLLCTKSEKETLSFLHNQNVYVEHILYIHLNIIIYIFRHYLSNLCAL